MSQDLVTQLREYGEYQHEMRQPVAVEDLERLIDHRMVPVRPSRPNGLLIGIAALVGVLLLMGGAALLFSGSGEEQPAAPTTAVDSSPTTAATVETPTTIASTDPTLAVEPGPPPGEGPQLGFVPVELPSDESPGDGVWFQGALYATSRGDLFRSSDGFTWELLPGPPDVANLQGFHGLETDGGLLVYAGVDGVEGSSGCTLPGDAIVVHTSNNGVDWKTSRIDLPIPDTSSPFGCFSVFVDLNETMVAGPQGIMITALIHGAIVPERIFEAEFGLSIGPGNIGDGFMEAETDDGKVYEIDLEAAGYLDDIESWLSVATDDPNVAERAFNGDWGFGKGYGWFSPDGQTWSQLDASGPLDGGEIAAVVATPGGFVATSTSRGIPRPTGLAERFLWETTDGATWIQKSSLSDSHLLTDDRINGVIVPVFDPYGLGVWDGRLVAATEGGVWTIEDTPQELIASDGMSGLGLIKIGELGLVGIPSQEEGGGTEILFSANGTTWNRWTPPEFGPESRVQVVGIGDDFVVLRVTTQNGDGYWVGRLP